MAYRVELKPAAVRDLARIPEPNRSRIAARIDSLAADPRPPGAKALKGNLRGHLRIRAGDYRILYRVHDDILLVLVVRIRHRKDAYD